MSYLKQTVIGTSWIGGFRLISRVIAFTKLAIIARILLPEQFGVYGIATLVLALLEIFTETGVNTVLIQNQDKVDKYLNTAWVISLVRGIFISIILYGLSVPIALFFETPEAISLLRLISVVPLIRGFINPAIVNFQKELQFSKEFWFRLVIFATDAVSAVALVYITQSPNGLIGGFIIGALIEVALSFIFVKPKPKLQYELDQVKEIITRGKWITGSRISEYLFSQGDDIVVGKLLGAGSLGIYQAAYKLSTMPVSEVADVISKVTFPVFVKLDKNKNQLQKAYKVSFVLNFVAASLLGVVLFIFSEEIVIILLGENWLDVVPILKILVFFGITKAVTTSFISLFYSNNRQDIVTKIALINTISLGILIIPFIRFYGLLGAPYAVLGASITGLPYAVIKQSKLLGELK